MIVSGFRLLDLQKTISYKSAKIPNEIIYELNQSKINRISNIIGTVITMATTYRFQLFNFFSKK